MRIAWFICRAVVLAGLAAEVLADTSQPFESQKRPNVVLIMTDNHGAWTLGCYGNRDIRTPHIDQLAAGGIRFTRAFACNPVCSPTRATALTGLMPSQHGVHCFLTGGRLQVGPQARCTLDKLTSLPEILKANGYACGLVGKWHLGANLQPQEGFDDYWITTPHGGTSTFYNAPVIENGEQRNEPQYLTDFWTDHAVRFLHQRSNEDRPFFLFLSYNGPYALSRLLLREGKNRHAEYYADKEIPSFPREKTHPWQYSNRDYHNNPVSIRRVATEVSGVDDGVGRVMSTLEALGLDDDTLVVFVADQGWSGGHGGYFGMGDHTRPVTATDPMMQIPLILRQPDRIPAGQESDRMVANYDLLPTMLNYLGLSDDMPAAPKSPGLDLTSVLLGTAPEPQVERPVFYEFEGLRCIRTTRWKYVHRHANGPHELYDLWEDPDEFHNVVDWPAFSEHRRVLKQQLDAFFAEYSVPEYDMWNGGGSQTRVFEGIDEELAQLEPAEPPSAADGFQAAPLEVPEGFTVELAAGPPLVTHPTLACFDDRGRLFVCNNAGVNRTAQQLEQELPNEIRVLEDRDHDGRFDHSTVFADKMTFPMGGAWHDGALYVASPPNIWRLEDTDGDNVADRREILVSQFGYTGNAASIHGCFWGPDGRMYWCDGYHGHEFRDASGEITSQREGSYLFSCRPDGSDVQIHCGGGMDNPVEVDFTEEGELLGTVNILYTRPRVDALVHWQHGGVYPHRERVLQEVRVTGELLGPVHRFGHVAVSGATRYRSGVMDHRWRDNFFVTFFNLGKVVRLELDRRGSTFRATQRAFLSSTSRDFHPTDVLEDADGSLLVVDTGGWFYRGCPTSQLSKPEILGGIYRVRRRGMTTQPDPRGERIDWKQLTAAQVAAHFNDTRFAVRETAIQEAAARGASLVPTLQTTLQRRDIRNRRNTVWALTRMIPQLDDPAAAQGVVRSALADSELTVRLSAARSIATNPDPQAVGLLLKALETDLPPIRREAAKALGRIGSPAAIEGLLAALEHTVDREEEHAIIFALIELDEPTASRAGLQAEAAAIQRGTLLALDQMPSGSVSVDDLRKAFRSDDEALRLAAWQVLQRRTSDGAEPLIGLVAEQLREWLKQSDLALERLGLIEVMVTAFADHPEVAPLIGQSLAAPSGPDKLTQSLLNALAANQPDSLHESWLAPLSRELESAHPERVERAISTVSKLPATAFVETLREISRDESRPPLLRVAAIEALSDQAGRLSSEGFAILLELVHSPTANDESRKAAQLIGASNLDTEQLVQLAPALASVNAIELRDLIKPYQRSTDLAVGKVFLDTIEGARSLVALPIHEVSDIVKRYPAELLPQANQILDRLATHHEHQIRQLDRLIPLLDQGDAARGREIFFSEKAKCGSCHRVGEEGKRIGPDLGTIGANRSELDLLESIVLPSASIVRDYESYTVATVQGRIYTGVIGRQSAQTLQLQQQTGEPITIDTDEIDSILPSTVSIMPNGLDQALTQPELADVIAWLRTLR